MKKVFTYVSAAAVILLLATNIWLLQGTDGFQDRLPVYTELYAPHSSRVKFNLPDGSTGWLNGGSSIKFISGFPKNERKVILNGEAYFNVVKNPAKSFIVATKYYQVRALGTSFNVQAYDDMDSFQEVTLESGKLLIEKIKTNGSFKKILYMKPGQHARLNYARGKADVFCETDKYTAWKDGKIIFRNDPFSRIIKHLQRYYNIQIEVKNDELLDYSLYATFEEETLFETLRLLKLSSGINYKMLKREKNEDGTYKKRKVILFFKG